MTALLEYLNLCNYAEKLHRNAGMMLSSFTPSLLLKLVEHIPTWFSLQQRSSTVQKSSSNSEMLRSLLGR